MTNNINNNANDDTKHSTNTADDASITLELIRKRSEHNEGLISTLEELALHQEEIESIGPTLGKVCGKTLRILLLQNNVIGPTIPLQDWKHFQKLEYVNLALNNLMSFDGGMGHLEFLNKIDLTLNFIGLGDGGLTRTVETLRSLRSLRELFMVGNPCALGDTTENDEGENNENKSPPMTDLQQMKTKLKSKIQQNNQDRWSGYRMYIIGKIPQLSILDGKEIKRSDRIRAIQCLPQLEMELDDIMMNYKQLHQGQGQNYDSEEEEQMQERQKNDEEDDSGEEVTKHCPKDRLRINREIAQQKADKERKERENQPNMKGEKEYELEQRDTIYKARQREEEGKILQCNEGKWQYSFDEESKPGHLQLHIHIQKYLSSSLIDVDIHPTYISIIIKSKILRLVLPTEVKSELSKAQRSTTTGHLLIVMPKDDPTKNVLAPRGLKKKEKVEEKKNGSRQILCKNSMNGRGLNQEMYKQAQLSSSTSSSLKGTVRLDGLVKKEKTKDDEDDNGSSSHYLNCLDMKEIHTIQKKQEEGVVVRNNEISSESDANDNEGQRECGGEEDDDDDPPPPF